MDNKTIKSIRQKLLLTQKEFADEIGVSLNTVQRWEYGKVGISYKHQRKIIFFCKLNGVAYDC